MRKLLMVTGAAALLASCGQSTDEAANQSAAKPSQPKKKMPYCFFTEEEMKGWSAKRGKDGNITVKGKVYRDDSRYQAILKPATVTGPHAEVSPDLQQNAGPYGAENNWWDVSQVIPGSTGVDTVDVTCGGRTLATFKLPPKA